MNERNENNLVKLSRQAGMANGDQSKLREAAQGLSRGGVSGGAEVSRAKLGSELSPSHTPTVKQTPQNSDANHLSRYREQGRGR